MEHNAAAEVVRQVAAREPTNWTAVYRASFEFLGGHSADYFSRIGSKDRRATERARLSCLVCLDLGWGAKLAEHTNRGGQFMDPVNRFNLVRQAYSAGRLMGPALGEIASQDIHWPETRVLKPHEVDHQEARIRRVVAKTSLRRAEFQLAAMQTVTAPFYPTRGVVTSLLRDELKWKLTPAGHRIIEASFPAR